MYMNNGYLNQSHLDFKDKSQPLIVGSCGTYRLSTLPKLPTYRPVSYTHLDVYKRQMYSYHKDSLYKSIL